MSHTLVALGRFDLRIPACGSLKQKRHVVKSLTSAVRLTFQVSVAEVDHHDLWQRTTIAVAAVGASEYQLRRVLQSVRSLIERWTEVEVIQADVQVLGSDG